MASNSHRIEQAGAGEPIGRRRRKPIHGSERTRGANLERAGAHQCGIHMNVNAQTTTRAMMRRLCAEPYRTPPSLPGHMMVSEQPVDGGGTDGVGLASLLQASRMADAERTVSAGMSLRGRRDCSVAKHLFLAHAQHRTSGWLATSRCEKQCDYEYDEYKSFNLKLLVECKDRDVAALFNDFLDNYNRYNRDEGSCVAATFQVSARSLESSVGRIVKKQQFSLAPARLSELYIALYFYMYDYSGDQRVALLGEGEAHQIGMIYIDWRWRKLKRSPGWIFSLRSTVSVKRPLPTRPDSELSLRQVVPSAVVTVSDGARMTQNESDNSGVSSSGMSEWFHNRRVAPAGDRFPAVYSLVQDTANRVRLIRTHLSGDSARDKLKHIRLPTV
ncbi:hypothetical protein C8R43DRAFT_951512 [Mycena crocata]|nr:hypothetical protein C8R43DRAFT_951512 [Mycena crocata]